MRSFHETSADASLPLVDNINETRRIANVIDTADVTCCKSLQVEASNSGSNPASECQICLEDYTAVGPKRCTVTRCGHLFCFECIVKG